MNKIFVAYLLISLFGFINASTYYVDKNATGSNNGTNWSNAWTGFSAINWSLIQPGDIIYVSGGIDSTVYNQQLTIGKSGNINGLIMIRNSSDTGHNGRVIIRTGRSSGERGILISGKSYVYVKGFELNGNDNTENYKGNIMADNNSNHFVIDSIITIADTWHSGIFLEDVNNFIVKNCVITTPRSPSGESDGIYSQNNSDGSFIGNRITISSIVFSVSNDRTHSDGIQSVSDHGMTFAYNIGFNLSTNMNNSFSEIYVESPNGGTFKFHNNFLYGGAAEDMSTLAVVRNTGTYDSLIVYNNTLVGTGTLTYRVLHIEGFSNPYIKNNIVYSINSDRVADLSNITNYSNIDYNCWFSTSASMFRVNSSTKTFSQWKSLGADVHGLNANPLFKNITGFDFGLQSGSPVIGAGIDLGAPYNVDINGMPRTNGNYSMGAYEYSDGIVAIDNTPPNLLSALVINPTTIELTFSEALEISSALTKTNYLIDNGIIVNTVSLSSDGKKVTLSTVQNNANQIYTVVVSSVKDLAGNIISSSKNSAQYSYVGDTTPPNLLSALIINSTTIELTFSETLESISASNKTNYLINNGINVLDAVPIGNRVKLTTTIHDVGDYNIVVNNVMDLAGNVISSTANSINYKYIKSENSMQLPVSSVLASVITEPEHYPEKTIDGKGYFQGDPDSRWAGFTMPEWLVYDLGGIQILDTTKLSFYEWNAGRIYQYSLQVSTDSITWNNVRTNISSSSSEWSVENVGSIEAKYVKIIFVSNNQSSWAGLWEAQFLGSSKSQTDIEDNKSVPVSFNLEQNYPNPFNPTTYISYTISLRTKVTLKVFDLLGSEVAELVNDEKEIGNYKLEFNGSNLPSGVYFYRLQAGSFVETKKMILIK